MRDKLLNKKTQTPNQRSQRMKLKRQIRKQRLYGITFNCIQQPESKQTNSNNNNVNRQEKQFIQKLKNRQAAQKSREQKKEYVVQLEEEIKLLKQKLNMLSHCQRCRNQLQIAERQRELQAYNRMQQQQQISARVMALPGSSLTQQNSSQSLAQQQEQQQSSYETSSFIRMSSTEQNSSIGIYLFVFMIMLGIFCVGTRMDVGDASGGVPMRRDLTQMFSVPATGNVESDRIVENNSISNAKGLVQSGYQNQYESNMRTTYSTIGQEKYQNGLLSMDQVRSSSLISDQKYFEKIITSFENYKLNQYDDKNLRSKVSLIDSNKSLMFCNMPKIYKSNPNNNEGVFSSFIDIFVKGAEIMTIFPQSYQTHLPNSGNFQLDGLYKITASVQQIEQIGNPNFIY